MVVDRLVAGDDMRRRLTDSVETALGLAGGHRHRSTSSTSRGIAGAWRRFSEKLACPNDHALQLTEIEPRTFSFNAPFGACPECTGIGTRLEVDPDLIVPDEDLTLAEGAIAAVDPPRARGRLLRAAARRLSARTSASPSTRRGGLLPERASRPCCTGENHKVHVKFKNRYGRERSYSTGFEGAVAFVHRRHSETDSEWSRERYEGYMREIPCPVCNGASG